MSVGIIFKSKFFTPDYNKPYSGLIDYIDRESAKNPSKVIDREKKDIAEDNERFFYENPFRRQGIFSANRDSFTKKEKSEIKKEFNQCQKNHSLLWSTIFSFDNQYLEENNLMIDGKINEDKFILAARNSMNVLIEKENLNATWVAGIHYDKDHIHIHFGITEIISTRKKIEKNGIYKGQIKGTFKESSLRAVKSACLHSLYDFNKNNERINYIIRDRISGSYNSIRKNKRINKKINYLLSILEKEIPETYKWSYGRNEMMPYRELIDEIVNEYIDKYHSNDFDDLTSLLKEQNANYNKAYGVSKSSNDNFMLNKLNELSKSLGNQVLRECRNISKQNKLICEKKYKTFYDKNKMMIFKDMQYDIKRMDYYINRLLYNLNDEYVHIKNKIYYELQQFKDEMELHGYDIE